MHYIFADTGSEQIGKPANQGDQSKFPDIEWVDYVKEHFNFLLGQSAEYDDNIFLSPRGQEESDIIFNSSAGVHYNFLRRLPTQSRRDEFQLGLSYIFNYETFIKHSRLSGFDHVLSADVNIPRIFGKKLSLTLQENFHSEALISKNNDQSRETRIYRLINEFGATFNYPVTGKWNIAVPYRNTWIKYLDNELKEFDSVRNSIGVRPSYQATQKTSFFTEGIIGRTHYYRNSFNDFTDYTLIGGMNKELNEKIHLDLSGGFQYQDNDHGSDVRSYIFDASYRHIVSPQTNFGFNANRTITQSLSASDRFVGTRSIDESIREDNPTITITSLNGFLNHFLNPKISTNVGGRVSYIKEESGSGRKDFLYLGRVGITYYFKRNLTLNFAYIFTLRDSNESNADYIRNRFILSINYGFGSGAPFFNFGAPIFGNRFDDAGI